MITVIDKVDARERAGIIAFWESLTWTQREEAKAYWSPTLPAGWIGHKEIKVVDRQPTGDLIITLPATR